jgi:hypothetical protein
MKRARSNTNDPDDNDFNGKRSVMSTGNKTQRATKRRTRDLSHLDLSESRKPGDNDGGTGPTQSDCAILISTCRSERDSRELNHFDASPVSHSACHSSEKEVIRSLRNDHSRYPSRQQSTIDRRASKERQSDSSDFPVAHA